MTKLFALVAVATLTGLAINTAIAPQVQTTSDNIERAQDAKADRLCQLEPTLCA